MKTYPTNPSPALALPTRPQYFSRGWSRPSKRRCRQQVLQTPVGRRRAHWRSCDFPGHTEWDSSLLQTPGRIVLFKDRNDNQVIDTPVTFYHAPANCCAIRKIHDAVGERHALAPRTNGRRTYRVDSRSPLLRAVASHRARAENRRGNRSENFLYANDCRHETAAPPGCLSRREGQFTFSRMTAAGV